MFKPRSKKYQLVIILSDYLQNKNKKTHTHMWSVCVTPELMEIQSVFNPPVTFRVNLTPFNV